MVKNSQKLYSKFHNRSKICCKILPQDSGSSLPSSQSFTLSQTCVFGTHFPPSQIISVSVLQDVEYPKNHREPIKESNQQEKSVFLPETPVISAAST